MASVNVEGRGAGGRGLERLREGGVLVVGGRLVTGCFVPARVEVCEELGARREDCVAAGALRWRAVREIWATCCVGRGAGVVWWCC